MSNHTDREFAVVFCVFSWKESPLWGTPPLTYSIYLLPFVAVATSVNVLRKLPEGLPARLTICRLFSPSQFWNYRERPDRKPPEHSTRKA